MRCYCCDTVIPFPLRDYRDIKLPDRSYCVLCWLSILEIIIMQDPKKVEEYVKEPGEIEILDDEFEAFSDSESYFSEPAPRRLLPYGDEDLQGYNDEDLVEDYQ